MTKEQNIVDQAVKALAESTIPKGPSEDLIRQILEQIEKQQSTLPFMERMCKMKSISKFAAAAIIIIGVSALFLFNSSPGSIALADVYAKVQQAQAFMYKMSMTMNGTMAEGMPAQNMESEATAIISTEHGMKMENIIHMHMQDEEKTMTQQMYMNPKQKTMIMVMPDEKKYMRMEFGEDLQERMKKQNNDPREMIKQILNTEYTDLGFSEIDGVKVQGFRSNDPSYSGGMTDETTMTLWVDINTWLPVRSGFSMKMGDNGQMQGTIYDFQWNIDVTADEFVPVIPDDYKEMANVKMPEMNEESAMEGLRLFADLTGTYPEKIDMMSIMKAMGKMKDSATEAAIEFKQQMNAAKTDEEKTQVMLQKMVPLQSLSMFYATLMQEKKDPMYYGNQVTPTDADAVLMRWKVEGDTYKVIFGDLTITEMQYDDLVQIEPQPLEELLPAP
jgi:outer membrane lipoprotein-sorting protein